MNGDVGKKIEAEESSLNGETVSKKTKKILEEKGVEFNHPDGIYLAMIPCSLIDPNKGQPRTNFVKESILMLAKTLKSSDSKYAKNRNPVIVTERFDVRAKSYRFLLEDGERRWRAARKAGTEKLFCIVVPECDDIELMVHACLANHCRENLDMWDSARSFEGILEATGWARYDLAKRVGVSVNTVHQALKLLELHPEIKKELNEHTLDSGLAYYFYSYSKEDQPKLLKKLRDKKILIEGKKNNPPDFSRELKKVAKTLEVQPVKDKKGRTALAIEDVIFSAVSRNIKKLNKEIQELLELSQEDVKGVKKVKAADLAKELEHINGVVVEAIEYLSV